MSELNLEQLFKKTDDMTAEKIILKFFDTEFLNLKTEIPDSALMALVNLEAYVKILEKKNLKKTAMLVSELCDFFKQFMISRNRQSRGEGERMLGALREQLKTKGVLSKLLGAE